MLSEVCKLCPFCGGKNVEAKENNQGYIRIECFQCDARGPESRMEYDLNEAIYLWNNRV